jgi:hypothetical protein
MVVVDFYYYWHVDDLHFALRCTAFLVFERAHYDADMKVALNAEKCR